METETISTVGSLAWILVQVLCIGFTLLCAMLLGAIQLERAKGGPVSSNSFDWTIYLVLAIVAGLGLTTLAFMDSPAIV